MNEQEHVTEALSTHWIKYIAPVALFAVTVIATIVILIIADATSAFEHGFAKVFVVGGVLLFSIVHHWFFHKLLSEAMEDIIITDKRIIWLKESLFCCNEMRQIQLNNIQGVEARKNGILQTILGYGTVWFDTGGTTTSDENARMELVPHPHRVAKHINQLRDLR